MEKAMKNNDKSKCFEQTQITTAIAAMCHELKLPSFCQAYMDQMKDPSFAEMAFPDRLHPMLKPKLEQFLYSNRPSNRTSLLYNKKIKPSGLIFLIQPSKILLGGIASCM